MMISEEQVRRAVEYLRTSDEYRVTRDAICPVPTSELIARVVESLRDVPEVREDRIAQGRQLLRESLPSSDELATKLIGRVVSDSIR